MHLSGRRRGLRRKAKRLRFALRVEFDFRPKPTDANRRLRFCSSFPRRRE
ncbi:hypothetical protein [Lysobacter gummosus]